MKFLVHHSSARLKRRKSSLSRTVSRCRRWRPFVKLMWATWKDKNPQLLYGRSMTKSLHPGRGGTRRFVFRVEKTIQPCLTESPPALKRNPGRKGWAEHYHLRARRDLFFYPARPVHRLRPVGAGNGNNAQLFGDPAGRVRRGRSSCSKDGFIFFDRPLKW